MKESAKAQHKVDKANFEAAKAEAKANFEENRFENSLARGKAQAKQSWDNARSSSSDRLVKEQEKRDAQIEQANARKAAAGERTVKAKEERAEILAEKAAKRAEKEQK